MAFDLIQFLIASGIGAGVGLLSGLIAIAIGKRRLNKRIKGYVETDSFISKVAKVVFGKFGEELFAKQKKCSFCNKLVPDEAIFCAHCGKLAKGKMNCPNCDHSFPEKGEYWHKRFSSEQ